MRTVNSILNQMTDAKLIMQELKDTLRTIDPMFQEEEHKFREASAGLVQEMVALGYPQVREYLAAKEEEIAMELLYIGWQGFQLNLEIFKSPVTALLLNEDFEDLHLERRLCALPATRKVRETQQSLQRIMAFLPEDKKYLLQAVTEYYSYLQTTGYKLAHYFGFRLADQFLPYVFPGYVIDPVITFQYAEKLEEYLQLDLKQME